jgi:hypothetical protein
LDDTFDNRAISSVNLLQNKIGMDQAKALASILKEHPTLKSLCGNKGDETELDMSRTKIPFRMDEGDTIMLAAEIVSNGTMMSLNVSGNLFDAESAQHIADGIEVSACVSCSHFGTIFVSIWPLVEMMLFTAVHRIMGPYRQ